jgi:3-hydroxyacyl-[acyl-carrier-protein] dehydratase
MKWQIPTSISEQLVCAERQILTPPLDEPQRTVVQSSVIRELLPHRPPLLFVDRMLHAGEDFVVAEHDLANSAALLAGHFPGSPIFPGVLQAEAVSQAALCLHAYTQQRPVPEVRLAGILGARFLAPVVPPAALEIRARIFDDGLFLLAVGQCLQAGTICSVIAVRLYESN